jgi:excisionase family DNA binding protein
VPHARTTPRNLRTVEFSVGYLKVSQRTVRRYIADGLLRAHRVGGTLIRIDQADLDALIVPLPTAGGPDGRGAA